MIQTNHYNQPLTHNQPPTQSFQNQPTTGSLIDDLKKDVARLEQNNNQDLNFWAKMQQKERMLMAKLDA